MNRQAGSGGEASVSDRVVATHMTIRVALTGISLAVVVSVLYQMWVDACPLTSISAYWYTDARAVFAGGLMVISICLIAYSGGTWTENLLLNLAGVLAPIVAIAPTTLKKQLDKDCLGARAPESYDSSATTNGLVVYFVVLLAGALFTFVASSSLRRRIGDSRRALSRKQKLASRIGRGVALAVPLGLLAWALGDDNFPQHAHFPSAATMFFFLALVAGSRSNWGSALTKDWDLYRDTATLTAARERTFPYSQLNLGVAIGMLATLLLAGVNIVLEKKWDQGWDYGVITAEFAMLGLFLVFWFAQTVQMRDLTQIGSSVDPDNATAAAESDDEPPAPATTEVMA